MRFEEFLKEREYLLGVSKKTLIYYQCAFNSWTKHATDGTVLTWVAGMKTAGLSNISVNTHICAMRAYFKWAEPERSRIAYLKEEQKVLSTFRADQVALIVNGKPVGRNETRARVAALTALDTREINTASYQ
jgi:site-specific recombinase XerD